MYLVPPPLSYAATVKIPFGDKVVFLYQTFFFIILFILCFETFVIYLCSADSWLKATLIVSCVSS